MSYIRFSVFEKDNKSGVEKGLFTAMADLLDRKELYEYELLKQKELSEWFKKHLRVPEVLSSESNHYARVTAISWFKDSAKLHIYKFQQYAAILKEHDVHVNKHLTSYPGKIVYEDEFQITAIPFADTFKQ